MKPPLPPVAHFEADLRSLIHRWASEADLSNAEVIGTLTIILADLLDDAKISNPKKPDHPNIQ